MVSTIQPFACTNSRFCFYRRTFFQIYFQLLCFPWGTFETLYCYFSCFLFALWNNKSSKVHKYAFCKCIMLTKCCSDSCFCLWGMSKFTACLKRKKKKREQRKWKEGEERKLEINKKEGEEMRGKLKSPNNKWGEERIHREWKMQKQIRDQSAAIFYKRFIMSKKRKKSVVLPKIWSCFFSPSKWFELSNTPYLYSHLCQAFLKIKFEHKGFVLINSNSLWNESSSASFNSN